MKKLSFILLAFGLLALASCVKEDPAAVEFSQQSYQMVAGDTLKMSGLLKVTNSVEQPVFTSSDEEVAAFVSQGVLVALNSGSTTVKAAVEGVEASCLVEVSDMKADTIIIRNPASILAGGDWRSVSVKVEPANYNKENLTWEFTPSSSDLGFESEKVDASEYKIKCASYVKDATIAIEVTDKVSGKKQTAVVEVRKDGTPASRITLTHPQSLTSGEEFSAAVTAAVASSGEYDLENLEWSFTPSSPDLKFKEERVSAAEYKLSFLNYVQGAYVTVYVQDAMSEVFSEGRIKVLERPQAAPTKFALEAEKLTLYVGDEPFPIQLYCEPANYDSNLFVWSSSDENVVAVDKGIVTVVGEGSAVIKVRELVFDTEASCEVTVKKPVQGVSIKRIVLNETNIHMRVGEDAVQLIATCYDENDEEVENYADLFWSAEAMLDENENEIDVVEVFQQGLVKAKNAGSTQVVVSDKVNTYVKAICNVSVQAAVVKVSEVQLVPSDAVLPLGESLELTARVLPENADDKRVTYSSSNESVATVNANGVVTSVGVGETVIKAVATNGVWGEARIKVANGLYFHDAKVMLVKGKEAKLSIENITGDPVTWESSDASVVTVDNNGTVKGVEVGEATITATAGGNSASCVVEVLSGSLEFDMTLNLDAQVAERGLMQGKTIKLNPQYLRRDNDEPYYPSVKEWTSSDETIAAVDENGNVTAVAEYIEKSGIAEGKTIVITHIADGKEASVEIVIVKAMPEQIVMTAVPQVNGESYKMLHGDTFTFKAKVLPEKANQGVWFAGGGNLSLHENTYTANVIGVQYFTAYAADDNGVRLNFAIEVVAVPVASAVINHETLDIHIGDQAYLDVTITPSNASFKDIAWTSSAPEIVSVNGNGKIEGLAVGTAVITGKLNDGKTEVSCTVNVTEQEVAVNVGDYYYANGRTSSSKDEQGWGDIIGVVFSTQNPSLHDSAFEGKYTRGLVISLEETANVQWQEVYKYKETVINPDTNEEEEIEITVDHTSNVGKWLKDNRNYSNLADKTHLCGYSNTQMLKVYNEYNPDTKVLIVDYEPEVKLPVSASGWYIPSYAELEILKAANNADLVNGQIYTGDINERIAAAGGTPMACERYNYSYESGIQDAPSYWSSTESDTSSEWALVMHMLYGGQTNKPKYKTYYRARYIFAF